MATIRRFEDLQCWQLARQVSREIYALTRQGGMARDFGLSNQIRRASGSIMDNIAEGFDRGSRGEFIYFLGIAKGSAGEVRSQLYRALDQGYLSQETFDALSEQLERISRAIKGLLTYLNRSETRGERFQTLEEPATAYETYAGGLQPETRNQNQKLLLPCKL